MIWQEGLASQRVFLLRIKDSEQQNNENNVKDMFYAYLLHFRIYGRPLEAWNQKETTRAPCNFAADANSLELLQYKYKDKRSNLIHSIDE